MVDKFDFAERDGPLGMSPRERSNWDTGVFTATRVIYCEWDERTTAYNELIGQPYPYIAGTEAIAIDGKMAGWGESSDDGAGGIAYEQCQLTMYYSNVIRFVSNKWITEELLPSSEFRQLNAREFSWVQNDPESGGRPVKQEEAPSMRQVFLDYHLTYHKVLAVPAAVLTHQGACNHATVSSYTLNMSFPAETVILAAVSSRRSLATGFLSGWELHYHFRITPQGANKFWRADTKQWETIYRKNDSTRYIQHPLMNFTLLIP